MRLSVCCLTAGPIPVVASILSMFRNVAWEIVCAVDVGVPKSDLDHLNGIADKVFIVDKSPSVLDSYLGWLHSQCSGDWVLKIDSDEVPSQKLLDELPNLIESLDIQTYLTTRRWSFESSSYWLNERPWYPDWQDRLLRNNPSSLRFHGVAHTNSQYNFPLKHIDTPIYHLDCLLSDLDSRREKVKHYNNIAPGLYASDGRPLSDTLYLPEITSSRLPSLVPDEDRQLIELALAGRVHPHTVVDRTKEFEPISISWSEINKFWAQRKLEPSAYACEISAYEACPIFRVGSQTKLVVSVKNLGDEIWPYGNWYPAIKLGYRWYTQENTATEVGFFTSSFTCDVHPNTSVLQEISVVSPNMVGTYTLVIDVLHEGVAWFGMASYFQVEVI